VRRERATEIIDGILAEVTSRADGSVLDLVTGIDVFGSYARGASDPGDVDLNIELDRERLLDRYDVYEFMRGRHQGAIKKALVGGSRAVNLIFEARINREMYAFDLTPLWNEGDDLGTARAHLHAIREDPTAGRAPRDHMIPELEGLEQCLPVYLRQHIIRAVDFGAITVEQTIIGDARVADAGIGLRVDERWKPRTAPNRVAHALLAHYERQGVDPGTVHLQGQDIRDRATPFYAGFGCRYLRHLPHWFAESGGREHVEIPRSATKTAELLALRIVSLDPTQFQTHHVFMWDFG
jgi:hypothetical protein